VTRAFLLISSLLIAACGRHQVTPLAGAARGGDLFRIQALIKNGADPNEPSGVNDWTPLMHAIHKNQREAAFTLVEHGADVDRATARGMTALMMAAGYCQAEIVKGLLARGADPRKKDVNGNSALDAAASGAAGINAWTLGACQTATVKALLDKAPDLAATVDPNDKCPEIKLMLERNTVAMRRQPL
jgi:ankyrin repeat protein